MKLISFLKVFILFFSYDVTTSYSDFSQSTEDDQLVEPITTKHRTVLRTAGFMLSSSMPTGVPTILSLPSSIPTEIPTGLLLPSSMPTKFLLRSESSYLKYSIYVNYLQDGLGSCNNRSTTCNLRSAIAACATPYVKSGYCDIYLPHNSTIFIDSSAYSPLEITMNFIITSYQIIIFGQGSTIKCLPEGGNCKSRFLFVSNSNRNSGSFSFHLYNVTVNGFGSSGNDGGAIYLKGLDDSVINKVKFKKNTGYNGGALHILDCSYCEINECEFVNNYSANDGGCILLNGYNYDLTISNNNFHLNNAGKNGAGINMYHYNSDIMISNNNIQLNGAGNSGGGIFFDQYNDNIILSNNNIELNYASGNGGGFYMYYYNNYFIISNNNIQSNGASGNGGGFYANQNNNYIIISNNKIEFNKANGNSGGGFYIYYYNKFFTIANNNIRSNIASKDGGGFFLFDYNNYYTISNNNIQLNSASSGNGGGIVFYFRNNIITLLNNNIHSNNAVNNGGGLYIDNLNYGFTISNNNIYSNSASHDGGGLYVYSFNNVIITSNNTIRSNHASGDGGGFYMYYSNDGFIISNSKIQSNTAASNGGGLYMAGLNNNFAIDNNNIKSNVAVNFFGGGIFILQSNSNFLFKNNTFLNNFVKYFGGAIYIYNGNYNFRFIGESFISNHAGFGGGLALGTLNKNISLRSCIFSMNEAYTGGAIHIDRLNNAVTIHTISFTNNSATGGNGGAILINDYNSNIKIDHSTFIRNRASINGGAVSISSFNSEMSFKKSAFIGNSAQDGGGMVIYIQSFNIVLESIIFENNAADNNGGALFVNYKISNMIMRDVHILNNRAESYGGGIYFGQLNSFISCERCIYHKNTAQSDGGGVYISQFNNDLSFINCIISDNSALTSGGGVYVNVRNHNIRFNSIQFSSNVVYSGDGGAVYAGQNNSLSFTKCNMTRNMAMIGLGSGAGLFSYSSNFLQILRSSFISNVGRQHGTITLSTNHKNCIIKGCTFMYNTATSGSAISVTNSQEIDITYCRFYGNYAKSNGGSIYVENVNNIILRNILIINSTAVNNGGGLFISKSSYIILHNNNLYGSRASHQGGGIYLTKSSSVSMNRCQFSNSTSEYGSAVYMSITTNVSIHTCSFINNVAHISGSVYWLTSNMTEPRGLNSSSSIWIRNHASYGPTYATDNSHCMTPALVFMNRYSGSTVLPAIPVIYRDYYGHKIITENSDDVLVSLDSWDGCTPSILTGTQIAAVVNGTAIFDSLSITCTTEGSLNLKFASKADETFKSYTTIQFSTFMPTSTPTVSPTAKLVVATADSSVSVLISDSAIIGVSVAGSLLFLLLLALLLWRFVFSPKPVYILDNLPLHKLLVDYSSQNNDKLLELIQSLPDHALDKDNNGKTALDVIFEDKDSLRVSSEVIFVLLLKSSNLEDKIDLTADDIKGDSSWLVAVQRNDDSTVEAIESLLNKFKTNIENIRTLANATDTSGRTCKDIAGPKCKDLILRKLYIHNRYEMKEGQPEHKSATSLVLIGKDHGVAGQYGTTLVELVALKFMRHRNQYLKEKDSRETGNFDKKFVLPILCVYDGDSDNKDDISFRKDAILSGYGDYPYCIVMEAATQDLKRFIDHDNIMNMDIDDKRHVMKQLTCCVDHIHRKNFIHGDVKPLNVLQKGTQLFLTDLDASCSIGNGVFAGSKYSSGYLPPEMFWCDPQSDGEVKVRNLIHNNNDSNIYDLVLAHPSQDMWALGCVFYQLCTGSTLFNISVDDNIYDQDELHMLVNWDVRLSEKKLSKINDKYARNLISQLLCKNPNHRPSAERALTHPFFTGKKSTRLQGDKAVWDIFLSYRVASDSDHVEILYHALTTKGLKVWWDKKCLLPGQPWEEGFCSGLVNSETFVCLLSRGGIKNSTKDRHNFEKLHKMSECDNVLLEWRLALELRERGMISGIYPVMIGDKDPVNGEYSNYFASGCKPDDAPDITIDSVEAKLEEHLEREGLGLPYKKSETVKRIVEAITANEGFFIEGDLFAAMSVLVKNIQDMKQPKDHMDIKPNKQQSTVVENFCTEIVECDYTETSQNQSKENEINKLRAENDMLRLQNKTLQTLINENCNPDIFESIKFTII